MEVATVQVTREEALRGFKHYRSALRARLTEEDRAVVAGYEAIIQGRAVLDLLTVFREGGLTPGGWPKLAAVRADAKECWLMVRSDRSANFNMDRYPASNASRRRVDLPIGTLPEGAKATYGSEVMAVVPTIPPHLRPAKTALDKFHILWEADWKRLPPRDPILMRRLQGWLFAVVATWDLTEMERAVLGQRIPARR